MLVPLAAKRAELIATEVVGAIVDLGGFAPRIIRVDRGCK